MNYLAIFLFLFTFSCSQPPTGLAESEIATTGDNGAGKDAAKFRVEIVASNLEVSWTFAFLPGGDLLFTERPGRVRLVEKENSEATPFTQFQMSNRQAKAV